MTIKSLTLGDTRLSYVPDGTATLNARMLLPEPSEQDWAENADLLDEGGFLTASVGGLLVERDGRALLIDAGVGPITVGPPLNPYGVLRGGALLDNLAVLGLGTRDVEAVALTHLHTDHVGWATQLVFPKADFLVSETEWAERHVAETQGLGDAIRAVEPRVRTVADGEEIFPGVHVMLAPGHSPGHTAYVITAGEQRVIAFGDAFHSPIQISHPLWENTFDHDHKQATSLRHDLVQELAQPDVIGFGVHFAGAPFGRVAISEQPTWAPIED